MTTYKRMDDVLMVLNEGHNTRYNPIIEDIEKDGAISKKITYPMEDTSMISHTNVFLKIPNHDKNIGEVKLILDYLVDEKYCTFHKDENRYSITYRGKVLIEGGGFSKEFSDNAAAHQEEIDQRSRAEGLQISVRDLSGRAANAAWFAGLMALVFLLWEVLKFFWLEPARDLVYSSKGLLKIVQAIF